MAEELPAPDMRERGADRDGQPQVMDRRLFFQLLAFDCTGELGPAEAVKNLGAALDRRRASALIYEDVNDPLGIAVLSLSEDPSDFVVRVRPAFSESDVHGLQLRHELTMIGRTYSSGFEPDLPYWLLQRPRDTVFNEAWPWAVWYPLRRTGAFEKLEPRDKGVVLREHAQIGKAYGHADLAHDIRLACHGLDANDNEFVIGLCGRELHPLSHVVQSMRRTRQTSEFIARMGPFFVGHVAWRSKER
jgi:hypothetical protein